MRKNKIAALIVFCIIAVSSCGNKDKTSENHETVFPKEKEISSQKLNDNYEHYTGTWSEDGKTHEDIINKGGTEFSIEITDENQLTGYLYSQQESIDRFAEIKDIKCSIENDECYYAFSDDGWGNRGTLYIQFKEECIEIRVQDFILGEANTSGFGIDRTYILEKEQSADKNAESEEVISQTESLFQYHEDWSEEEILEEISKRKTYLDNCTYYEEVLNYLEDSREVKDVSMYMNPLYDTDKEYYSEDDFIDVPLLIIYLAKNEIYARHGYIFEDTNLNNYFMGQLWYVPSVDSEEFDVNVFSNVENENLELLSRLDTYKK